MKADIRRYRGQQPSWHRTGVVGAELSFPLIPNQTTEIDVLRPDGTSRPLEMRVTEMTGGAERTYAGSPA